MGTLINERVEQSVNRGLVCFFYLSLEKGCKTILILNVSVFINIGSFMKHFMRLSL